MGNYATISSLHNKLHKFRRRNENIQFLEHNCLYLFQRFGTTTIILQLP